MSMTNGQEQSMLQELAREIGPMPEEQSIEHYAPKKNGHSLEIEAKLATQEIPITARHIGPIIQALNDRADRLFETGQMFHAAAAALRQRAQIIADSTVDTVRRADALDEYATQAQAFLSDLTPSR